MNGGIAAPQKTRLAMTNRGPAPAGLPPQAIDGGIKRGYTLLEVVLAVVVVAVAVSATLVIMSKMMSYTASRGQAIDIANAVAISQRAIDRVRDQKFPPTGSYGNLDTPGDVSITMSNVTYTYRTEIVAANDPSSGGTSSIGTNEYDGATGTDSMLGGYRNLLKITVTVFKSGRPILKTVTYKTRNGYY